MVHLECPRCHKRILSEWKFCPFCGLGFGGPELVRGYNEINDKISELVDRLTKLYPHYHIADWLAISYSVSALFWVLGCEELAAHALLKRLEDAVGTAETLLRKKHR